MKLIRVTNLEKAFPWKHYDRIFHLNELKYVEYNYINNKLTFNFGKEVVYKKSTYTEYYNLLDKLNKKDGDIEV